MSRKPESDVWLAGLGALAVAQQEGSDLFRMLVKKGEELEHSRRVAEALKYASHLVLKHQERTEPPGPDEVSRRQAQRLEAAREAFLKEFGDPSTGVHLDLERWRREGKIFTVRDGEDVFVPSFQFDERGHPRPAVARVIQLLGGTTSEWGLALWFVSNNGWIDGKRPVDLLASAPEDVVEAAERSAEELVF
jgi:poly(hydroxyalkanoate) granule-associated protein